MSRGTKKILLAQTVFRHFFVIIFIAIFSGFTYLYSNPYCFHRVFVTQYKHFDTAPDADGITTLKQGTIDFRLPRSTLALSSIQEIRGLVMPQKSTDLKLVSRCAELVRKRLNAIDTKKPRAITANAEALYSNGSQLLCWCSEHAILLNEILQVVGLQSRVLWLEGHVTAEYFDRNLKQWVFVDPHMNIVFTTRDGAPLSASKLIYATERKHDIIPTLLCPEDASTESLVHNDLDELWYRNVLLNGECYTLSGNTLQDGSRWVHLVKFRQLPTMLVLATQYDSSHAKHIEPFKLRKYIVVFLTFLTGVYIALFLTKKKRKTSD